MAKGKDLSDEEGKKVQFDALQRDYILEPHLGGHFSSGSKLHQVIGAAQPLIRLFRREDIPM